ncbi:DUF4390 domain-containing protein [Hydrogenophaga sp.]|uniref:DUF4390 domain-containing protein n=1 Tax=Hydrogenophaga sp. TaxID=1904254 RepID=UPI003F6CDE5B
MSRVLRWLRLLLTLVALAWLTHTPAQAYEPEILQMGVQRTQEALYLSARLKLEPAAAVEDALLKGVPLYFAWQADVYRQRWYWTDKRVSTALRTLRLAYQPLTRRWRLSLSNDASGVTGAGLQYALHQNFDSLADALAGIGRVSRWKVSDAARLQADDKHRVEWRFRLDLSLLPRPFQIGMSNQPEWDIAVQKVLRVPTQAEPEPHPDGAPDLRPGDELGESVAAEPGR